MTSQTRPHRLDRVNSRVYFAPGVHRMYSSQTLSPVEAMTLLRYQPAFANQDVLDIGVGAGRTSRYLAPLARRYEGIDYSPVMIEHVRATMPQLSFQLADMRDLSMFGDGSFDFVLGSNNVLDAVSHEDRLLALSEIRRVLRPEGVVLFSSHNRSYTHALSGPRLEMSRNPIVALRDLSRYGRMLVHHAELRKLRRHEPEYTLLNDNGHDFALLHYYIEQRAQRRQLAELGFRMLSVHAQDGRVVSEHEDPNESCHLTYVAMRVPAFAVDAKTSRLPATTARAELRIPRRAP